MGSLGTVLRSGLVGRALALVSSLLLIVSVFAPWTPEGAVALDLSLRMMAEGIEQPTVALALVAVAALPAVAALVGDVGWPRSLAGALAGTVVLGWLAMGPQAAFASGVVIAIVGAIGLLVSAALAVGSRVADEPRTEHPDPSPTPAPGDVQVVSGRGHRVLDHTADSAFEAWGPTRAACFEEAVTAMVATFAETTEVSASDSHHLHLRADDADDLLVDVLAEVVYLVDAHGIVPVAVELHDEPDGGLTGAFGTVEVGEVRPAGAVPKAVTYHGLDVRQVGSTWRCRVTIDV